MKFAAIVTVTLLAAAGLGTLLFGSDLPLVVDTAIVRTQNDVKESLGTEFRLDQATQQLTRADQEITEQEARVAKLRVSCRELGEEVRNLTQAVKSHEREFAALDDAWQRTGDGTRAVAYRSQLTNPDTIGEALHRAALQITSYNNRLATREQVLSNQTAALEKAERMLQEIRTRRERVALAIDNSRVDLESVRLLQSAVGTDVDASALAAAEELARELSHDLQVQREIVTVQDEGRILPSMTEVDPYEAVEEVRARLRGARPTSEPLASAAGGHSGFSY